MSGEYFEIRGEETGERYASGTVLTDDVATTDYLLSYTYGQAAKIMEVRQTAERLSVDVFATDPADDGVSEYEEARQMTRRSLAVRLAWGILHAYVSPSPHRT